MKKLLSAALVLLLHQTCLFAQWQWLNPKPSGYINNSIVFTDTQTGYIINTNGDLLTTNNQGTTWQLQQHFDYSVNTMNIAYGTGIIAGYNNLIISVDNGITWQKKDVGIAANFKIVDIVSRDTIFIAGDDSKIYKTTNRGQTWQTLDCGVNIRAMDFANAAVGYAGGPMLVRKTIDGGQTWKTCLSTSIGGTATLTIKFVSADTGYAFRELDGMLRTTDGGVTWKTSASSIAGFMYSVSFPTSLVGYMGGENGLIYHTKNGGVSWEASETFRQVNGTIFNSMYFINNDIGFAVGLRGVILKTNDGGITWNTNSSTYIDMTGIAFGSKTVGYATDWNNIYKTTNSGLSWNPLNLAVGTVYPDDRRFTHAHFFNADTGFVISTHPIRIYKTYDQGQNWQQTDPGVGTYTPSDYDYLADLDFINKNTAIASLYTTSSHGLFKTNDGGDTWKEIGSSQNFDHLSFLDEKNGYAAQFKTIYFTSDSGKTWIPVFQEYYDYNIRSLYFLDAKTGFYSNDDGLYRTTDSGKTWTTLQVGDFDRKVIAIKFYNKKLGYFTAEGGGIYKTVDAGLNWQPEGKSAYYSCPSITFSPDTTVYVAGMYGAILKAPIVSKIIDSLQVTALRTCSANFSARISAAFSTADSIQFEYGENNFNSIIAATPDVVKDSTLKVSASVNGLQPDTSYTVRLKYFYQGNVVYSNTVNFKTPSSVLGAYVSLQPSCNYPTGSIMAYSSLQPADMTFSIDSLNYNNTSGVFYNVAPGNYKVTAISGSCLSSSAVVTVISNSTTPAPAISSGTTTLCQGSNITLTSNATTGNQWYKDGDVISGAVSTTFNINSAGSYTATATANGCISSPSNAITIISGADLPQPDAITGAEIVCENAILNYAVTAMPGVTSYTWTLPSGWSGTSATNSITATVGSAGGTISVTANNGCGSSLARTLTVGINPAPTITSQGDTILISSTAPNYQWFYNNNLLSGEHSNTLRVKKIGFYRVETSRDTTCWSASLDFPILVLHERLAADTLSMEIYPNPAVNNFSVVIRLQKVTSVIAFVTVANAAGNVALQTNKLLYYGKEIKIPVSLTGTGTYFVTTNINGDIKTMSVILQ